MTKPLKIILLLWICIVSFSKLSAQHENSFFGIRFGYALPMGQMSLHDYAGGGYAMLGKFYGAEGAWFINPHIGFGFDASASTYGFAAGYYADDYKSSEPAFDRVEMLSGPYSVRTYLGGGYFNTDILKKLHVKYKLMAGMIRVWTPNQFFGVTTFAGDKLYFWKTSSYSSNLAALAGVSLEYRIYEKVSLLLQADFTYAEMGFIYSRGATPNLEYYTKYMKMPIIKLQPGINLHF